MLAVGAQTSPSRNSFSPIVWIAGRPEMIRYTLMNSTKATATMPQSKKIRCTAVSMPARAFFLPAGAGLGLRRTVCLGDSCPRSRRTLAAKTPPDNLRSISMSNSFFTGIASTLTWAEASRRGHNS